MNNTIKEVFDDKYFHGRLTHEEAYNLCKEEMTNTGEPCVYICYLFESNGRLQGIIRGYRHYSETFADWFYSNTNIFSSTASFTLARYYLPGYGLFEYGFMERKNPHTLLELARIATLDNCDGYCCLRSLIEKIDELQIPTREKEELRKLAHGFEIILVENLPHELCIHN